VVQSPLLNSGARVIQNYPQGGSNAGTCESVFIDIGFAIRAECTQSKQPRPRYRACLRHGISCARRRVQGSERVKTTMSASTPQSFKSHARFDPPYHFVLIAVLVANLVIVLSYAFHHLSYLSEWMVILSIAIFIPVAKLRSYPLKVQDRIIRLEERIRLQALAPEEWHAQIYRLNEDQLIGLRFASDEEVVELAKQALEQNLNRKQIKERIKVWRPDDWRV